MTPRDELVKAARRRLAAKKALAAATDDVAKAIPAARLDGTTHGEIVQITKYEREHVRRILRAAGIGPDGKLIGD